MDLFKENLNVIKDGYENAEYAIELITGQKICSLESLHNSKSDNDVQSIADFFATCATLAGEKTIDIVDKACDIYFNQRYHTLIENNKTFINLTDDLSHIVVSQIKEEFLDIIKNAAMFDFSLKNNKSFTFNENYWHDFIQSYPVVVKSLEQHIEHWDTILADVFYAFSRDNNELANILNTRIHQQILNLKFSLGDLHEIGKSIVMVETTSGKFIFKSRSAVTENTLAKIINQLNNVSKQNLNIGLPLFICKGNYSWHEFIEPEYPSSLADVYSYYRGVGHLLALSYALFGYDFHYENIIIRGRTPFVIDTECLFVNIKINNTNIFSDSVLNTCLIPSLNATERDIFRCGIGIYDQSKHEFKMWELKQDCHGVIWQEEIIGYANKYFNSPDINIREINFETIKNEIINGFDQAVGYLSTNVKEVLKIISKEDSLKGRVLFRSSKEYAKMIFLAKHPRFIMSNISKEMLMAALVYREDVEDTLMKEEYQALLENRIPLFVRDINSGELSINNKKVQIKNNNIFNSLREHISNFDKKENLDLQRKLIKISLETIFPRKKVTGETSLGRIAEDLDFIINDQFLYKNKKVRLNLKTSQNGNLAITSSEVNIYSGLSGLIFLKICLFLSCETSIEKKEIELLYQLAYQETFTQINEKKGCGAFESVGSLLYLSYLMAKHISREYFIEFKKIADKIIVKMLSQTTPPMDIISGLAGILIICTRMYWVTFNEDILFTIKSLCAVINKSKIIIDNDSITWEKKYTGFSHGNSGIIYSLALANEINYDQDIVETIKFALYYERKQRISDGWKDLRDNHRDVDFNSWCHGAPGIFMSRKALLQETKTLPEDIYELIQDDINYYHKTYPLRDANDHPSLCHGIYGIALIEESLDILEKSPRQLLFDTSNPAEERSLMTGILGKYYAYIKLNDKTQTTPNLLLLS